MNHVRREKGVPFCTTRKICHPERSLATSEANGQTQSKDPWFTESSADAAGNFRIEVRFFDEQGLQFFHGSSREAAAWESPARKCRVGQGMTETSPVGTAR